MTMVGGFPCMLMAYGLMLMTSVSMGDSNSTETVTVAELGSNSTTKNVSVSATNFTKRPEPGGVSESKSTTKTVSVSLSVSNSPTMVNATTKPKEQKDCPDTKTIKDVLYYQYHKMCKESCDSEYCHVSGEKICDRPTFSCLPMSSIVGFGVVGVCLFLCCCLPLVAYGLKKVFVADQHGVVLKEGTGGASKVNYPGEPTSNNWAPPQDTQPPQGIEPPQYHTQSPSMP